MVRLRFRCHDYTPSPPPPTGFGSHTPELSSSLRSSFRCRRRPIPCRPLTLYLQSCVASPWRPCRVPSMRPICRSAPGCHALAMIALPEPSCRLLCPVLCAIGRCAFMTYLLSCAVLIVEPEPLSRTVCCCILHNGAMLPMFVFRESSLFPERSGLTYGMECHGWRSMDRMKDRDGLKSIISLGHGQSRGAGRSWLLDESDKPKG